MTEAVYQRFLKYLSEGKRDINAFMIKENIYGIEVRKMLEAIKEAYMVNPGFMTESEEKNEKSVKPACNS